MIKPLTFTYLKEFVTISGKIIKMKSLISMHGVQSVECMENDQRYPATTVNEVINQ